VYEQIDAILRYIVDQKMKNQTFLRSRIQAVLIEKEEAEAEKARAIQEEEDARKRREEAAENGEEVPEEAKSVGNKTNKSIGHKS
jgi:hypothetical protein